MNTRTLEIVSTDRSIRVAVERAQELHARARRAAHAVTEANAQAAAQAREWSERRAQAFAVGEPDPGPFDATDVERQAHEAVELSASLQRAADLASESALDVCEQREAIWQKTARQKLDAEREALLALVEQWEQRQQRFREAWLEVAFAHASRERRRNRVVKMAAGMPTAPDLDALRGYVGSTPTGAVRESVAV